MRKLCILLCLLNAGVATRAQTPNRTPEQKRSDSLAQLENERLYPEIYRFNRAPFILKDSSAMIMGFGRSSLRLQNNYIVDSIHNNFHNDMPDTTTVTPYSAVSVGGPRVTISYAAGLIPMGIGSGEILPTTIEAMRKDSVAMRNGDTSFRGSIMFPGLTTGPFLDTFYVRLTLNGRLLSDWKDLQSLPATFSKGIETFVLRGKHYPPMHSTGWAYTYLICDTVLNVHDQLLIEIKDSKRNWMLARFNFTRVATAPQASALRITGEDGHSAFVTPVEKKTSASGQVTRTSR